MSNDNSQESLSVTCALNLVPPLGHNKMRSSNCWKYTCIHENKKEFTKIMLLKLSDNLTSFYKSNKIVWHQSMKSVHFYNLAESVCWVNVLMFSLTWKCQNNDMSKKLVQIGRCKCTHSFPHSRWQNCPVG